MSNPDAKRLEREISFHDQRFAGGDSLRQGAAKYYSVAAIAKDDYQRSVVAVCAGKRLLEYGCGAESQFAVWESLGAKVTGIDISEEAVRLSVEVARTAGSNARFEVMNAEELKFGDGEFDLVVGTGILHHLELKRAYAEIARVLAAGGRAVFFEPLGHNPAIRLYRWLTPKIRTPDEHPLLMPDLALAKEYFSDVQARFYVITTLLAVPLRNTKAGSVLHDFLYRVDRGIIALAPFLKRYCWIVVLEFRK